MNRPLNIIFCLPGNSYSGNFLKCWHELTVFCLNNNINPILSQNYSCNIYYSRTLCLGGNSTLGELQKPFNNKIDYDYLMWIDSDVIFKPSDLMQLLSHQLDIVSGLYLTHSGNTYATVKDWDVDTYKQNGRFDFLTLHDIKNDSLFEVSYTGFGFILIKNGVFETIKYPWFKPRFIEMDHITEFTMEDVTFCLEAKEAGFQIMIDPTVKLGHEKMQVLI